MYSPPRPPDTILCCTLSFNYLNRRPIRKYQNIGLLTVTNGNHLAKIHPRLLVAIIQPRPCANSGDPFLTCISFSSQHAAMRDVERTGGVRLLARCVSQYKFPTFTRFLGLATWSK